MVGTILKWSIFSQIVQYTIDGELWNVYLITSVMSNLIWKKNKNLAYELYLFFLYPNKTTDTYSTSQHFIGIDPNNSASIYKI